MLPDADIINLIKTVSDLERRVAVLEAKSEAPKWQVSADACPKCAGLMKLTDEKPHPTFGLVGLKVRTFACVDCGKAVERDYDPA